MTTHAPSPTDDARLIPQSIVDAISTYGRACRAGEENAVLGSLLRALMDTILAALRASQVERDEALAWTEEDQPLPEDAAIEAAHPVNTNRHENYVEALRLVGAKRSKGALVDLVNWLLERAEAAERKRDAVVWAIDDAMIVRHIGVFNAGDDAKDALNKIGCWDQMVALDPAVSEAAQALIDKGRADGERERDALREALEPFVAEFEKHVERYLCRGERQIMQGNFDRMPDRWPMELDMTMGQCRAARAALAPRPPVKETGDE